jgi:hypothetical protein
MDFLGWELEKAISNMLTTLTEWELSAKRTEYKEGEWDENSAKKWYGTYSDEEGTDFVCRSLAEKTCVELIKAATKSAEKANRNERTYRNEIKSLRYELDKARKFASMSDRRVGEHMEKHIRTLEDEEGQETVTYTPEWFRYIARRLKDD